MSVGQTGENREPSYNYWIDQHKMKVQIYKEGMTKKV